jgi:hypothetical protein
MIGRTGLAAMLAIAVAGCESNKIHRYDILKSPAEANAKCDLTEQPGGAFEYRDGKLVVGKAFLLPAECKGVSIELAREKAGAAGKAKFTMFFIELDEQGRFYDDSQFEALRDFLVPRQKKGEVKQVEQRDLSIVTFVHGWRNNAKYDNANVGLARQVLDFAALGERSEPHPNPSARPREVVGVYVGWRGKSLEGLAAWEALSVWDRKNTAQNVAVGSVREVFSYLKAYQELANTPCSADREALVVPYHCKRVRLMIVGHSFGGLMAYNAVAGSLIDNVTRGGLIQPLPDNCKDEYASKPGAESALVQSFADLIVLINPAVEGARFEPLHQVVARRAKENAPERGAFCPNQRPVLISITSAHDWATRYAFRAARFLNTILESTRPIAAYRPGAEEGVAGRVSEEDDYIGAEEGIASINAMGHVRRFHTHFLRGNALLVDKGVSKEVVGADDARRQSEYAAALKAYCDVPPPGPEPKAEKLLRACRCGGDQWWGYAASIKDETRKSCPAYVEELNAAEMMTETDPISTVLARRSGRPVSSLLGGRSPGWVQSFCGGPAIQHLPRFDAGGEYTKKVRDKHAVTHSASSPVWNVYVDDESIIQGHSDLYGVAFQSMLQQIYHAITIRNFRADSFSELSKRARDRIERDCPAI